MRTKLLTPFILLALVAGCSGNGGGQSTEAPAGPPVVASAWAVRTGNAQVLVEWRFEVAEDWHLYWPGLNDSGFPPDVRLDMPSNWRAGELRWPVPTRKILPGDILDHVLEGPLVVLQQTLELAPAPHHRVTAHLRWLACKEACVPGDTTLVLDLTTDAERLGAMEQDIVYPQELPGDGFSYHMNDETLVVSAPGAAALRFFPFEDCGPLMNLIRDGEATGERLWLRLRPRDGGVGPVRGLLQIESPDGTLVTGPLIL